MTDDEGRDRDDEVHDDEEVRDEGEGNRDERRPDRGDDASGPGEDADGSGTDVGGSGSDPSDSGNSSDVSDSGNSSEVSDSDPDTPDEGAPPPTDGRDAPREEDRGSEGNRSLPERLHELAEELLEVGSISGAGRGGRISYGYSARTGPGRPTSPSRRRTGRRPSRRTDRADRTDRPDAHSTVERNGDDLRVVADLPGVDAEELTVGVDQDRDELVVAVAERVLTRVPLEGADTFVNASLNNDVLTVHLTSQ